MMASDHNANAVDRRIFLSAGTASVLGLPSSAIAQPQSGPAVQPAPTNPRKPLGDVIAAFATGFALADAPANVVQRARTAFVDTVGVMLAGSQLPPVRLDPSLIEHRSTTPADHEGADIGDRFGPEEGRAIMGGPGAQVVAPGA